MVREDNVVTVKYQDGALFCQHEDGTKIYTNADGSELRVEKLHFASVSIKLGASHSLHKEDPFDRSLDKRVMETFLPDGGVVRSFADMVNTKHGKVRTLRHVLYCQDLSIILSDGLGHASIISANARASLNELGEKKVIDHPDKDSDYLIELRREYSAFTPQVF